MAGHRSLPLAGQVVGDAVAGGGLLLLLRLPLFALPLRLVGVARLLLLLRGRIPGRVPPSGCCVPLRLRGRGGRL